VDIDATVLLASSITGVVALLAARIGAATARSVTEAQIARQERERLSTLRLEAATEFNKLALDFAEAVSWAHAHLKLGNDPLQDPWIERVIDVEKDLRHAFSRVLLVCSSPLKALMQEQYHPAEQRLRRTLIEVRTGVAEPEDLKEALVKFSGVQGYLLAAFRDEVLGEYDLAGRD
jgi:hypothetical protein